MMRRILVGASLMALTACATTSPVADGHNDPLAWIEGDFQVVNTDTGEVILPCETAQMFRVNADRSEVTLRERTVDDWSSTYRVIRIEEYRILMIVTDEDRLTDAGDPILWWARFDGPNRFRWRQYDWPNGNYTNQWQRCEAHKEEVD